MQPVFADHDSGRPYKFNGKVLFGGVKGNALVLIREVPNTEKILSSLISSAKDFVDYDVDELPYFDEVEDRSEIEDIISHLEQLQNGLEEYDERKLNSALTSMLKTSVMEENVSIPFSNDGRGESEAVQRIVSEIEDYIDFCERELSYIYEQSQSNMDSLLSDVKSLIEEAEVCKMSL